MKKYTAITASRTINWPIVQDKTNGDEVREVLKNNSTWVPVVLEEAGAWNGFVDIRRPSASGGWVTVAVLAPYKG